MVIEALAARFRYHRELAEAALGQVADADLGRALGGDENSIAVLVQHLGGNLRSRFTDFPASDGEKPWRDRDAEFVARPRTREELLEPWRQGWRALDAALGELDDAGLGREVRIRGQALTVLEALVRALAHVAYHVGQLVQLARHFAGPCWRSLSIPRGGSAAYNRDPGRER